jgi:hypothetical protein
VPKPRSLTVSGVRRLAVGTAAAAALLAGCTSASHKVAVPITHPAPGYGTPGAAVMGFFTEYAAGKNTACSYVISTDFLSCDEAISETDTKATIAGFGIGETTVEGNEALVTVVGSLCVSQGAAKNCRHNTDPSVGQPRTRSLKDFDALFSKAGLGRPINSSALPCENISGKWYFSLEGDLTS